MLQITRALSKEETARNAAEKLNSLLWKEQGKDVLLLLSSGSALSLCEMTDTSLLRSHTAVGMLDERFTKDPAVNNFAQFEQTAFFQRAKEAGVAFLDSKVKEDTVEELSERMEEQARSWREKHFGGAIIITQGMGSDGHTAGMLPFLKDADRFDVLFQDPARWVRGYDAGNKNRYAMRATFTMSFLHMVDHSVLYACGADKRDALEKALDSKGALSEIPARIIHDMKDVSLFTDIL